MENAFRNLRSLSHNGLWRGDERNACGLCEQFRYWPVLLPQIPQLLSSRWFATLLAHNSPYSLDSTTKERKVCRVLRFEDDSAIQENLHSHKVIAEQIRKSLQVEAKTKIVGFGPGASVENILQQLDQFYGDQGAAVGHELLSGAYNFRQHESEEVSAWITKSDKPRTWR